MIKEALMIVDPQNDFCPGGSLAVKEGDEIMEPLNKLLEICRNLGIPVFISRDWHVADNTAHMGSGRWPLHCIQGTHGVEFHSDLNVGNAEIISKGMNNEDDGYSAFEGTTRDAGFLAEVLREAGIESLVVGGLATDYCVKATVLDACRRGFTVRVIKEAIRAVDLNPGDGDRAIEEMQGAGAQMVCLDVVIHGLLKN